MQCASLPTCHDIFKESVDKGNEFGALLTDLSNAFDCIDRKLLIAKLVSSSSLNLICTYLSNRTQRLKTSHSDLRDLHILVLVTYLA